MKFILTFLFSTLLVFSTQAQKKPAYQLFTVKGKRTSYRKLLKHAKKADIILFGEEHNNPIAHWLQYELTRDLQQKRKCHFGQLQVLILRFLKV